MKELSLNVLDIAKNSVKAGASLIGISLIEKDNLLTLTITDNGCGMTEEELRALLRPEDYIGRCPEQVDTFLAKVRPLLEGASTASDDIEL